MAAFEDDDDDYYFVIAGTAYEEDNDGGFAIAASSEEEDDEYIKVITTFVPPPLPLQLQLPSSPSSHLSAAAAIAPSSPAAPYADDEEEEEQVIDPSPSPAAAAYVVNDDIDPHVHDAALRQQDGGMAADTDDMTQAPTTPDVYRYYRPGKWDVLKTMDCGDSDGEVTEEEEEENEDDYRYQGYYDLADRGRARHVKRSSGRRGRTKKASTMGRPRGDVRQAHCSVNI